MRNASLAVLREIGVETGGSNVQFGINPKDGRMVIIEMNHVYLVLLLLLRKQQVSQLRKSQRNWQLVSLLMS